MIRYYNDLESIYAVIKKRAKVDYKTIKSPLATALGVLASVAIVGIIAVSTLG